MKLKQNKSTLGSRGELALVDKIISNPVFTKGNPYNVKVGPTYYMIADDARDACW